MEASGAALKRRIHSSRTVRLRFELTVIDNRGATATTTATVIVGRGPATQYSVAVLQNSEATVPWNELWPNAMNNKGETAGTISWNSAFLHRDGTTLILPVGSEALDLNSSAEVVGYSSNPDGTTRAFLFSNGVGTDIGTFGGASSIAFAINDSGQVVGMAETEAGLARAFLYQAGAMNLSPTLGGSERAAMAINNQGQVAGAATTEDGAAHALIYDANGIRDIETLGHSSSIAVDINESGQAVGWEPNRGPATFALASTTATAS